MKTLYHSKVCNLHHDKGCASNLPVANKLWADQSGGVLLVAMMFLVVMTLLIGSMLSFTGTETVMISRRTSQMQALYGAESSVRRSMAQIRALYFSGYSTNSYLTGNLAAPTDTEISTLASAQGPSTVSTLSEKYDFPNVSVAFTTGTSTNRYISYAIASDDESLSAYAGLTSQRATLQCSTKATTKDDQYGLSANISQKFNIDYIPVFQYAVFYNMDMEIFNGPTMTVNGKVHSNGTLYYAPAATLTVNANLTASEDIERGIKLWNSSKPKLLSSADAATQTAYSYNQSLWEADTANWASTDPTVSGYGEANFYAKISGSSSTANFKNSDGTFFDSESSGWAGGALTRWNGGVKTEDQGIDDVPPPIPSDVIASATDSTNPYHVMLEHPVLDSSGVSTESSSAKSAKMVYSTSLLIQRSGTTVNFLLRDAAGTWHPVNNLRNASNIVPTSTATFHDQREYLQNGSVKMTVTEFDIAAFYGSGSATGGATDSSGVWRASDGSVISTDANGVAFTPVAYDGSVYIYDDNYSSTRKPAVRINNGGTIYDKDSNSSANNGMAIISENPVYVKGNFNGDGITTTGPEKTGSSKENVPPAMIAADAVNFLSKGWLSTDDNPSSSASTYFGRQHASTTEVNAAILAGVNRSSQDVVASSFDGTTGGVNNFPRFLEYWGSTTMKYSGSMVSLWYGTQATSKYRGAGSVNGVFSAPNRDWAFNTDFLDPNKLPRCTPIIRVYTTADWSNL